MIVARANHWGVSSTLMLSIAFCDWGDTQIGETRSHWDPDAAANVAAYAVSLGGVPVADALPAWHRGSRLPIGSKDDFRDDLFSSLRMIFYQPTIIPASTAGRLHQGLPA
jgi:hypothetical protein